MATTASFAGSTLSILDDGASDTIAVSRNSAGAILVNGGAVAVSGGTPTVANTGLISVLGGAGDDTVVLSEVNGALPAANIDGEAGNDSLTGGSGNDQLFGGLDNDTLSGKGGLDTLRGGSGNDIMTGGDANDLLLGEAGDDRFIWNPGDDSDVVEGGDGTDTMEVNGGNGAEVFAIGANGPRVRFERITPAPFVLDLGATEQLVLNPNGGVDQLTINDLTGTDLQRITVNLGTSVGTGDGAADQVAINTGTGSNFLSITTGSIAAIVTVTGAEVADSIQVNGMSGSDTIVAGTFAHALSIDGGTETDTVSYADAIAGLTVNLANASLNTGAATSHIYNSIEGVIGSAFQDLLTGTADSNTLDGGVGADFLEGLAGDDFYFVDNAGDMVIEAAGGGTDRVMTSISLTLADSAEIEILATTDAASKAAINLTGNAVSQSIIGNRGTNYLKGKGGDDTLYGKKGNDTLKGGGGDDGFVFNTKLASTNIDTIKNYVRADDTIILDNDIFVALTATGKLAKSAFHASTSGKAHDLSDRILYETDTGRLYYDKDGTGSAQAIQFATLSGHPTIGANDFLIV